MILAQYHNEIILQQRQARKSLPLFGEGADRQIQLTAVEQVEDVERTAWATFERYPRSNLGNPSSQLPYQHNRRIIVHGNPKASSPFRRNELGGLKGVLQSV